MREDMKMTTGVLRVFANALSELADVLEPPRALARKFMPVGETAIDDLKQALKDAMLEDEVDREAAKWGYGKAGTGDEFEVPEEECREVAEAAIKEFSDAIGEAREDPEFKIYKRPTTDDLEDALLGIRRAQEALDHLRFGITKRRPDFALDLDGEEAEKCRLLNRLEELASNPDLVGRLKDEDPEFPAALLEAAEELAVLKKDYRGGAARHWEVMTRVEEMIDALFKDGVRVPTVKSGWAEFYERARLREAIKPMKMQTLDYDTTQRYSLGAKVFIEFTDEKMRFTSKDTGSPAGVITKVPSEEDPMLAVEIVGAE